MKKKKQTQTQEIKINLKPKRSIWKTIKTICIIVVAIVLFSFLLGMFSNCSSCSGCNSGIFSGCNNNDNPDDDGDPDDEPPEDPDDYEDTDDPPTAYVVTFYITDDDSFQCYVGPGEALGEDMPQDPVREGYEFQGWYVGGTLFTAQTIVNSNTDVFARWENTELCDHEYRLMTDVSVYQDEYGHSISTYQCVKCDEEYEHISHIWSFDETQLQPETDGYGHVLEPYICTLCNAETTVIVHIYENHICTLCDDIECEHNFVDGVCINCGVFEQQFIKPGTEPEEPCDEHVDENDDGKCDVCGEDMPEPEPEPEPEREPEEPCVEHIDENSDGKCDVCG